MPNWAMGTVEVSGTKAHVQAFAERFIDYGEQKENSGKRFFGRSFLDCDMDSVNFDIEEEFEGLPDDEVSTVTIEVSFAWSAVSCLVNGFPQAS